MADQDLMQSSDLFRPLSQRAMNKVQDDKDDSENITVRTRAISLLNLKADPQRASKFDQYMQSNKNQELETGE